MTDLYENVGWESQSEGDDGYGNTVTGDWAEQFSTRAGFTYLRGTEAVIAARLQGRQPIVVRVRASSKTTRIGTDWQMRNKRTDQVYAVRSLIPTQDRMFIDITVESGTAS